jgi:hypothetical protein
MAQSVEFFIVLTLLFTVVPWRDNIFMLREAALSMISLLSYPLSAFCSKTVYQGASFMDGTSTSILTGIPCASTARSPFCLGYRQQRLCHVEWLASIMSHS